MISETRAAVANRRSSAASLPPKRADIVERSRLAAHHPIPGREIGVGCVPGLALEHRLVEAGRQCIDQVDIAGELAVLLLGDAAGNEDAEMADDLMDGVDDGLSVGADFVDVVIQVENPIRAPAAAA